MAKSATAKKQKTENKGWSERLSQFARKAAYASPIYSAMLNGQVPNHLQQTPRDAFAGDINIGNLIMRGIFPLAGKDHPAQTKGHTITLWRAPLMQQAFDELHSFAWLRHLHAVGGNAARQTARQLLEDWFASHGTWEEKSWAPGLIGERLTAWLSQYAFFGSSADDHFRHQFFQSLMRQLRHLVRIYEDQTDGPARIAAVKGMLFSARALGDDYLDFPQIVIELQDAIHRQILADGCYYQRSPALQAQILQDLIEIRSLFTYAQMPLPEGLGEAIAAMARALRHLRHGDGGLALFHGAFEDNADFLDLLLVSANIKGKAGDILEESGWHRLQTGRSLLILDAGFAPSNPETRHQSPLAIEFSSGRERIIVNCGSGITTADNWIEACRSPAAHSTLSLRDYLPAETYSIQTERKSGEGQIWLSAQSDAYRGAGISHTRQIYANAAGDDIRGEDTITRQIAANTQEPIEFTIRFHLHPKIQSIEAQNSVILRTSGGAGWRLRMSGGKLGLENSVYLGQKGQVQKTKQIVISGELLGDSATVKWAIQKESKK
ncbi:MAG: hypothetical protein EYC62_02795 [Alphaproteobacteria bacterium]|nr:MAG: hypothetical protein EYC62_02795 [Alphaproteobacteria bacterium]